MTVGTHDCVKSVSPLAVVIILNSLELVLSSSSSSSVSLNLRIAIALLTAASLSFALSTILAAGTLTTTAAADDVGDISLSLSLSTSTATFLRRNGISSSNKKLFSNSNKLLNDLKENKAATRPLAPEVRINGCECDPIAAFSVAVDESI